LFSASTDFVRRARGARPPFFGLYLLLTASFFIFSPMWLLLLRPFREGGDDLYRYVRRAKTISPRQFIELLMQCLTWLRRRFETDDGGSKTHVSFRRKLFLTTHLSIFLLDRSSCAFWPYILTASSNDDSFLVYIYIYISTSQILVVISGVYLLHQ
jgi:hypothetical protein